MTDIDPEKQSGLYFSYRDYIEGFLDSELMSCLDTSGLVQAIQYLKYNGFSYDTISTELNTRLETYQTAIAAGTIMSGFVNVVRSTPHESQDDEWVNTFYGPTVTRDVPRYTRREMIEEAEALKTCLIAVRVGLTEINGSGSLRPSREIITENKALIQQIDRTLEEHP